MRREYLAYRLYNILTPNSYRVQLVRIRTVGADGTLSPAAFACLLTGCGGLDAGDAVNTSL